MEKRKFSLMVSMAVLILACASCNPRGSGGVIEIDITGNDSTVRMQVGEELVISLESNPTTGYTWQLIEPLSSILVQEGEVEFTQQGEEGLVGAGGVEVFRFSAEQAGTATIQMGYLRVWEEGVAPIETFSLTVEVSQ
jgi:inhibitor of cysteine peptidase